MEFSIDGELGEAVIGGQAESIQRYRYRGDRRHTVRLHDGLYAAHRIDAHDGVTRVFIDGEAFEFSPPGAQFDLDEAAASDSILAPLPGKIAAVNVATGARVKRGDVLAVLEAMKMEHALAAPRDGVVAEVAVAAGAQVRQRDLIVRLAPL